MRTWNFTIGAVTHTAQIAHDPIFSGELEIYVDGEQRVNQIAPSGRNFEYKCEIEGKTCLVRITYSGVSAGGLDNLNCMYDVLVDGQSQKYSGVQDLVSPPVKTAALVAEATPIVEQSNSAVPSVEDATKQKEENTPIGSEDQAIKLEPPKPAPVVHPKISPARPAPTPGEKKGCLFIFGWLLGIVGVLVVLAGAFFTLLLLVAPPDDKQTFFQLLTIFLLPTLVIGTPAFAGGIYLIRHERNKNKEQATSNRKPTEVGLPPLASQSVSSFVEPTHKPVPEDFDALVLRMLELVKESDRWSSINGPALYKDHPQYNEAQEIGKKLYEMGGRELMRKAYVTIEHYANRSGTTMAQHWWNGIGGWQA